MEVKCHQPHIGKISALLLPVVLLLANQVTYAQEQQAHVHGTAELFVVLDGNQLDIELRSPAMNLLGFEHRANNAELTIGTPLCITCRLLLKQAH